MRGTWIDKKGEKGREKKRLGGGKKLRMSRRRATEEMSRKQSKRK